MQLYSQGANVSDDIVRAVVQKDRERLCSIHQGAHAAHRAGQHRPRWRRRRSQSADLGEALDDMLFASGKLNVKLLGGAQEMAAG